MSTPPTTPQAITLDARTALFVIGIHARTAARRPGLTENRTQTLSDLAFEVTDLARFSTWYEPQNINNTSTRALTADHQQTAAAYGLPTGQHATAAFLRATAALAVRAAHRNGPTPSSVTFTAADTASAIGWYTATGTRAAFASGITRADLSYPMVELQAVLAALATVEPPAPGSTLTLHTNPLFSDPIPAGLLAYDGMPDAALLTAEQLRRPFDDVLTADTYVVQVRSDGRWNIPNHDDPATLDRGGVATCLRYLRDRAIGRPARFALDSDGTVYASDGRRAARYIPAALIPDHDNDNCPGCGTPYATNGDAPCPVAGFGA